MTEWLSAKGLAVNRKRVSRLMEWMGIEVIYPKLKLSQAEAGKLAPRRFLFAASAARKVHQTLTTLRPENRQAAIIEWCYAPSPH